MKPITMAALTVAVAATVGLAPGTAHAFCGFYVSGADANLFNNATQVVLMREGTRTVLSMQNNYQGPPDDFAMVVPVPVVLQEENVKTLPRDIFQRVDSLAAPRLVEYWEQDPCPPPMPDPEEDMEMAFESGALPSAPAGSGRGLGVTIEAQFTVGEYEIVILSARDSTGLDTWLRQNEYKIPEGAEPLLRPYVQGGMKFFVAKVDTAKVEFENGMAMLSPLRFHYDSEEFSLPVRLGMMNSAGAQDLIVHVLARGQRYEVANHPNVTIPTNLDVKDAARKRFGEFYAALFDRTVETNPGAVVTEYSWDASSCDPCPTPALDPAELATLGYDVLYTPMPKPGSKPAKPRDAVDELAVKPSGRQQIAAPAPPPWPGGFVLTRLHMRYGKGALADDLVFRAAPPIVGGREMHGPGGTLEQGSRPASVNNFQARYAIRHAWTGPIECENPRRGVWGGPPPGVQGNTAPQAATELAFAPRGKVQLASLVAQPVPELKVEPAAEADAETTKETGEKTASSDTKSPQKVQRKGGCQAGPAGTAPGLLAGLLLGLLALARIRRRPARGPVSRARAK